MSRQGRLLALAGALLTLMAPLTHANGLNLSWDACGTAGSANKQFACNTNVGVDELVLSTRFSTAGVYSYPLAATATLDIVTGQDILPSWWRASGTAACRPGAIQATWTDEGPQCAAIFGLPPLSVSWAPSGASPERRRLTIHCPSWGGLEYDDPGVEYYVCTVLLSHAKSVGPGSCGGCGVPACLVFNSLEVFSDLTPNLRMAYITNPLDRNFVTWQGGTTGMPICPAATPARNRTWGSLKSLYR